MKLFNSKGQEIVLNEREAQVANYLDKQANSLGFEVDITTLTTIMKQITEQKFYQVAPADYLPIRVGNGAWSTNLLTYRSFSLADDFTTGNINVGTDNSRLASADGGVDSLTVPVQTWAKQVTWALPQLQEAAKSGNWDLVAQKETSRKTNWDLGIQRTAFLGIPGSTSTAQPFYGLLNQPNVTNNTTLLTAPITSLAGTPAILSAFIGSLLNVYRANAKRTAWPTHFVIPESDYLGLATPSSPDFPLKSILQLMQETFQTMTGNKNFKILPSAYADSANSAGVLSDQTYALYNYAEQSLRMDIPVDYTNTTANSINNFQFQNVGYGQYTGALAYRPDEMLYLSF